MWIHSEGTVYKTKNSFKEQINRIQKLDVIHEANYSIQE